MESCFCLSPEHSNLTSFLFESNVNVSQDSICKATYLLLGICVVRDHLIIFCGRNQRSRVKTHIMFPPSLCNWSVTVSHGSQGAKGVHLQSDKSEKSDMFVGLCPSNLESLKWKKLLVLDTIFPAHPCTSQVPKTSSH